MIASLDGAAIVTRSCTLDLGAPLFTCGGAWPVALTVATAPPERLTEARGVADVLIVGERDVDLHRALQLLGKVGHCHVLTEGGPSLSARLAAADLVDELCLTIAPCLVGGDLRRILAGAPVGMTGLALHTR